MDSKAVSTRSTHALLVTVIVLSLHCIHAQNLVGYTYSCTILGTQDVFADIGGQGFSYSPDPLQECKNYVSGQTNDVRYTGTSHYGPPPDYFTYWVYECRYCVNNPCPTLTSGWYYNTVNSCNSAALRSCSPGMYPINGASCVYCDAGSYKGTTSNSLCTPCTAGSSTSTPGSVACSPCNAGFYSNGGASTCSACGAGTESVSAGASVCTSCGRGYYSQAGGTCSPCPIGKYAGGTGSQSCVNCGPGTYAPFLGMSVCLACSSGVYVINNNVFNCIYQADSDSVCSYGTYSWDGNPPCAFYGTTMAGSIGAGPHASHMCAILTSDNITTTVSCWGYNMYGEQGVSDSSPVSFSMVRGRPPVSLPAGAIVRKVVAGRYFTCVMFGDARISCFGISSEYGEVGQGGVPDVGKNPALMGDRLPYVQLPAGRTVRNIAAGFRHVCVVFVDGKIACWGYGYYGQLGIGSQASIGSRPGEMGDALQLAQLPANIRFDEVSCGQWFTCALSYPSSVYCWGSGYNNALGPGIYPMGYAPGQMGSNMRPVPFPSYFIDITAISCGSDFACALDTSGRVMCWGGNTYGQLGRGIATTVPTTVQPVLFPSSLRAVSISCGFSHACALFQDGNIGCWGDNGNGQVGIRLPGSGASQFVGDSMDEVGEYMRLVMLPAGRRAISVSCGLYTTCAILSNRSTVCWGSWPTLPATPALSIGGRSDSMGDSLELISLPLPRNGPGLFWNGTGLYPCPAGTYKLGYGPPACTACDASTPDWVTLCGCPAGAYSSAPVSLSDCSVCPAGTYSQWNSGACTRCSYGTYSLANSSGCSTCDVPSGWHAAHPSAWEYLMEPSVNTQPNCSVTCRDGKSLTFDGLCLSASEVTARCVATCGDGSYSVGCSAQSPGSCVDCTSVCPIGSQTYNAGCGGVSPGECKTCKPSPTKCADSTYYISGCPGPGWPQTDGTCTSCMYGCDASTHYKEDCVWNSSGTCQACSERCPAGQYAVDCGGLNRSGTCVSCDYCASGSYAQGCGGTSSGTCVSCADVYTACEAGAPGGCYALGCAGSAPGDPTLCDGGTGYYMQGCGLNSSGSRVLCGSTCSAGQYVQGCFGRHAGTCGSCSTSTPAGRYLDGCGGTSSGSEKSCNSGYYSTAVGATSEATCQACSLRATSGQGATACVCARGTYSPTGDASDCRQCLPHTYQTATGATTCTECALGTAMFNTYGATSNNCLPCGSPLHPAGTHATVPSNGYRTRGCEWACNAGYEAYNDARGEGCTPMIVTGPGPGSPTTAPATGRTTAPAQRATTPRPLGVSPSSTVAPGSTPSRISSASRSLVPGAGHARAACLLLLLLLLA